MKTRKAPRPPAFALAFVPLAASAAAINTNMTFQPKPSPHLQQLAAGAVRGAIEKFAERKLQPDQLAVTLVDLRDPGQPAMGSLRGDVQIYPASVIKLFYLAAAHQWLQDGKVQPTDELQRAMRDMIVDSGNEPAHYIIDLLTGTTSGPELPRPELDEWLEKRNVINRYFASLGYRKVNANRKPWWEGPYGREMQSIKVHQPIHRNWLTTDETARLLAEMATGRMVSPARCEEMLTLLARDPFATGEGANSQAREYIGAALPPGAKLWSKAGWTSQTRHDAALVELPNGVRFVLVIFTEGQSGEKGIIPAIASTIMEGMHL